MRLFECSIEAFGSRLGSTRRRSIGTLLIVATSLLLLSSVHCSGDDGDDRSRFELEPVPATTPSFDVEVGTGFDDFEEVMDGGPVDLTFGPQGGFHIWTAVRTRDTSVAEAQVNVSARYVESDASVGPASRWPTTLVLLNGGTVRERGGLRNFVDDAALANGKTVVLRAEIVTKDGRHGAGERQVIPRFK